MIVSDNTLLQLRSGILISCVAIFGSLAKPAMGTAAKGARLAIRGVKVSSDSLDCMRTERVTLQYSLSAAGSVTVRVFDSDLA